MQYQAGAKRPNFTLPKGEYSAKVYEAEEKLSKAGNPMLVLGLEVYDGEKTKLVKDYIVTGGGEHSQDWKIGHLMKACGLEDAGNIECASLVDRYVRVKLKIKPAKDGYQEDNAVDDYLVKQTGDVTQAETARASNLPPSIKPAIGGGASDQDPPFSPHDKWSWG